ncbi:hypothetical protein RV05_GL000010 [Enterococcus hirae]|nr:hypothetical protein RV05_GL000010 [Enterococcus hirae]
MKSRLQKKKRSFAKRVFPILANERFWCLFLIYLHLFR